MAARTLSVTMEDIAGKTISTQFYVSDTVVTLVNLENAAKAAASAMNSLSGCGVKRVKYSVDVDISAEGYAAPSAGSRVGSGATIRFPLDGIPNRSWSVYVPTVPDDALAGEQLVTTQAAVAGFITVIGDGLSDFTDDLGNDLTATGASGIESARKA